MRARAIPVVLFVLMTVSPAWGQAPQQASPSGIIRITVNLVQVDAVVTDSKGHQVRNLERGDFEILEDGRPQQITNFSYVLTAPPAGPGHPATERGVSPEVPPAPLLPQNVRRTIAFVVDDLGLSFESTYYVRQALRKFVDQEMLPGDLVAIIRTSSGLGTLQQFTYNKELLDAAIARVRWYAMGRGLVGAFAPMHPKLSGVMSTGPGGPGANSILNTADEFVDDEFRRGLYTVGTLGAISYVAKGLRDLPGRKSLIVLSDGFELPLTGEDAARVLDSLRALIDFANRSSVVIYAVDARGLQVTALTAQDSTTGRTPDDLEQFLVGRREAYFATQAGMAYLAGQTGGFLMHDTNDLNWGIDRILEDESGYYLIGYKPSAADFQRGRSGSVYHKLRVRVKVAGLHVRSRSGFYGVPDDETRPVYRTRDERLVAAIGSLFGTAGVHVRLASQFLRERQGTKAESEVRVDLHVGARDLSFQDQPDGSKKLAFDAAIMTFGEDGTVADSKNSTFTGALSEANYEALMKSGIDSLVEFPLKKPGAYQLRVAVLDSATGRAGSASQFIDVPNLRRGKLTVSGIILNATGQGDKGPAVRRFQPGDRVSYGFEVYNAKLDPATASPQLEGVVRIFHDRREVAAFHPNISLPQDRRDPKIPAMVGWLQLGTAMAPGDYVLQATITDKLAKQKDSVASQWTDFEIAGAPIAGKVAP